jgi:hypothetical protein
MSTVEQVPAENIVEQAARLLGGPTAAAAVTGTSVSSWMRWCRAGRISCRDDSTLVSRRVNSLAIGRIA